MKKQKLSGGKYTFLSSLALLIVSGWEASVRLDAMYKPIRMFFDLAAGEGIALSTAMTYFDFSIFEAPLWLLACISAALLTIFFSRKPAGAIVILPLSAALAVYGLLRESTFLTDLWRLIQPGLLLFNCAVILLNLAIYPLRRRSGRKGESPNTEAPRLQDAPRLRSIPPRGKNDARRSA